jgi:hypothetical protein
MGGAEKNMSVVILESGLFGLEERLLKMLEIVFLRRWGGGQGGSHRRPSSFYTISQ